ncbi:amidinotransferase [Streptomyces sp. NA04227]|uniref:dimethylargininase n=1 Tax=Streptomyces sp. NA04227 TaxID=2742136 RepID=UPI001590C1D7|nr:dimethylargininase [Streptomyces sp. NA04227]QKW10569.1 amidinotransferase [Streptomyces sp. NA04227]
MCEPRYFDVRYTINPWMSGDVPVDPARALAQWQGLVETYRSLGHTVETIEPLPGLPDMVFAANGAVVVDGRVLGSRFHAVERRPETPAFEAWFKAAGFDVREPEFVCEGEGDLVPAGRVLLAGTGFRTVPAAHQEAQEYLGIPVVSLHLTDPYFYHLDTALFVLDDGRETNEANVAYYPEAFSPGSREALERLYPEAVIATREDALAFGLNSVSDGKNVVVPHGATDLTARLTERGYQPVPVDVSEFHKAGGSVKCCTQEVRTV